MAAWKVKYRDKPLFQQNILRLPGVKTSSRLDHIGGELHPIGVTMDVELGRHVDLVADIPHGRSLTICE